MGGIDTRVRVPAYCPDFDTPPGLHLQLRRLIDRLTILLIQESSAASIAVRS
jgi:hypothetical protein